MKNKEARLNKIEEMFKYNENILSLLQVQNKHINIERLNLLKSLQHNTKEIEQSLETLIQNI